jgi:hypothetical protein
MKYNENIFIEDDIIQQLAIYSNKFVMHLKAVGAIECDDKEKEDKIWEFYYGKCDTDVLNVLMQFKEAYCYFETFDQATDAFSEWFPNKDQLLDDEMHLYVRVVLVSPDKSITALNE